LAALEVTIYYFAIAISAATTPISSASKPIFSSDSKSNSTAVVDTIVKDTIATIKVSWAAKCVYLWLWISSLCLGVFAIADFLLIVRFLLRLVCRHWLISGLSKRCLVFTPDYSIYHFN
jgi:hypothetical protein